MMVAIWTLRRAGELAAEGVKRVAQLLWWRRWTRSRQQLEGAPAR
jgi:hypothetical protein